MKKIGILSGGLILTIFFASCSKSNSTQPSASGTPQMSYELKASNSLVNLPAKMTGTGTIDWTGGLASPTMIKFEAKKGGTEIEYKSALDTTIDLMSSIAATFGGFTIPTGTYNEIELKIDLSKNGSNPALELDGTFTSGGVTTPVTVTINDFIEIQTEQHDVTIDSTESFVAVTTLDLSSISAGITETMLNAATVTGGTIVISATSNRRLYEIIVDNLHGERHHCEFEHHRRH